MKCMLVPAYGNPLFWSAFSALENPTTMTRKIRSINAHYDSKYELPVGHRVNLKAVVNAEDRLAAMSELIVNNKGFVNTYTLSKNWSNNFDKSAPLDFTPTFITAQTLPPVPVNDTFLCSSLSANAANMARLSQMFGDIQKIEGISVEEKRSMSLFGIGLGAPGLFLGLYGSEKFPGGQVVEYRNDLICQAFRDNNFEVAIEEIEFFEQRPPSGKN